MPFSSTNTNFWARIFSRGHRCWRFSAKTGVSAMRGEMIPPKNPAATANMRVVRVPAMILLIALSASFGLPGSMRSGRRDRLGGACQTTFRRTAPRAEVSGSLRPPRRHLQPSPACARKLPHQFLVEGLCSPRPQETHVARCGRRCRDAITLISSASAPTSAPIARSACRTL